MWDCHPGRDGLPSPGGERTVDRLANLILTRPKALVAAVLTATAVLAIPAARLFECPMLEMIDRISNALAAIPRSSSSGW